VLLVVLLGFLAMTVDLGRTAVVRTQLQNAADAAAMAGASALGTDNLIVSTPVQSADVAAARSRARTFAQANGYDLNDSKSVVLDPLNDVTVGTLTTPGDLSQALSTSGTPFNTVRVQTYVDADHGGLLGFLFAPVLGLKTTSVQATATASVQLYAVESVQALQNVYGPILPISMSYTDWQQMVNKQTGRDNYTFNPATGLVVPGPDGLQEQQLYPGSNATSSNNGLIQFGTNSRSNAVLRDQVVNGPTYDQMVAQWPPNGKPPWDANHRFSIGADPGWRATTFADLATVAASGRARLIPINDGTSPGNGANGTYTIVALAPIRVVYADKGGKSSGYALVQPAVIVDPTVISSATKLAATGQGGVPVVRLSR
jgi:hypothetical protein